MGGKGCKSAWTSGSCQLHTTEVPSGCKDFMQLASDFTGVNTT